MLQEPARQAHWDQQVKLPSSVSADILPAGQGKGLKGPYSLSQRRADAEGRGNEASPTIIARAQAVTSLHSPLVPTVAHSISHKHCHRNPRPPTTDVPAFSPAAATTVISVKGKSNPVNPLLKTSQAFIKCPQDKIQN